MALVLVVLLVVLISFIWDLGPVAYGAYALLGLVLLSRFLARVWLEQLQCHRKLSAQQVEVGQVVQVQVELTHRGKWPVVWLLLEDLLPAEALRPPVSLQVEGRRLRLLTLWNAKQVRWQYEIRPLRRGYYQIGPLLAESGDLFGFYRSTAALDRPQGLVVLPKVVPLESYQITTRRPVGTVVLAHRIYEDPSRVEGVRPYVPGDPQRRIHWRATARTGQLQSKLYEPSVVAGAVLVLDFHQQSFDPQHEPVRSDLACTAAASLAHALFHMNQQVGLVTNGRDALERIRWEQTLRREKKAQFDTLQEARDRLSMAPQSPRLRPVVVPPASGGQNFRQILETLGRLEFGHALSLDQLLLQARAHLRRDAAVVLILTQLDQPQLLALSFLRSQGYTVTVVLNLWDPMEFATWAARLAPWASQVLHLQDEASVRTICQRTLAPGTAGSVRT